MNSYNILMILVDSRTQKALEVQKVLTDNGCKIRTRLGLHETSETTCSDNGLIILDLIGKDDDIKALEDELNTINGVIAKNTKMSH